MPDPTSLSELQARTIPFAGILAGVVVAELLLGWKYRSNDRNSCLRNTRHWIIRHAPRIILLVVAIIMLILIIPSAVLSARYVWTLYNTNPKVFWAATKPHWIYLSAFSAAFSCVIFSILVFVTALAYVDYVHTVKRGNVQRTFEADYMTILTAHIAYILIGASYSLIVMVEYLPALKDYDPTPDILIKNSRQLEYVGEQIGLMSTSAEMVLYMGLGALCVSTSGMFFSFVSMRRRERRVQEVGAEAELEFTPAEKAVISETIDAQHDRDIVYDPANKFLCTPTGYAKAVAYEDAIRRAKVASTLATALDTSGQVERMEKEIAVRLLTAQSSKESTSKNSDEITPC